MNHLSLLAVKQLTYLRPSRRFDYLYYAFGYQCLTTFAGALRKWRLERGWDPNDPSKRIVSVQACEHIVVFNKRDLVPSWGMEVTVYQTCFAVTAF
jgi:hypothetical protein